MDDILKYTVREKNGALLVNLAGGMIADRMKNADKALAAMSDGHASVVVLDFAQVRALDEAGAGFVVTAFRKTAARGGRLAICRPSATVRRALEGYRLTELVRVFESQRQALGRA